MPNLGAAIGCVFDFLTRVQFCAETDTPARPPRGPAMSRLLAPRPLRSLAELRGDWRELTAEAERVGQRAVDTDGREVLDLIHYRHRLVTTGKGKFPVGEASGQGLATGFVMIAQAFNNAGDARRRALIGGALVAAARAVDGFLTAEADAAAASWKRQLGETD